MNRQEKALIKYKELKATLKVYLHYMLCCYLDADFDGAKFWLKMIKKLNHECSVESVFDKYDLHRYDTIKNALTTNQYTEFSSFIFPAEEKKEEVEIDEEELQKEKELVRLLISNENIVRKATGLKLKMACVEQETIYGNVDIMSYSKKYAIPIEVKLNRANHSVVSQIKKYMKCYFYKINYGLWKDVIGIVIAKTYSQNALQELRKINVIPLVYSVANGKLSLQKV